MKKKILLSLSCTFFPWASFAGMGSNKLSCSSTDKDRRKITIEATFEEGSEGGTVGLTVGERSISMGSPDNKVWEVSALNKGVYTLLVEREGSTHLLFYAIPNTVKRTEKESSSKTIFDGVIQLGPLPAADGTALLNEGLHDVPMSCTYTYEI